MSGDEAWLQLIFILPLVLRLLQDAPLQALCVQMPLYPWHAHRRLQRVPCGWESGLSGALCTVKRRPGILTVQGGQGEQGE